jgi:hypothetical protein
MSDAPAPDAAALLAGLAERFPRAQLGTSLGDQVASVEREDLVAFAAAAREAGLTTFIDLCAVDHLSRPEGRFEVVVNLLSMPAVWLRIHVASRGPGAHEAACSRAASTSGRPTTCSAFASRSPRPDAHPPPDEWEWLSQGHPGRSGPGAVQGRRTGEQSRLRDRETEG